MLASLVRHELSAAMNTELAVNAVEVFLHSVLPDPQLAADLLVRESFAQKFDSLSLPPGEIWFGKNHGIVIADSVGRFKYRLFKQSARQPQFASADCPDRLHACIGGAVGKQESLETIAHDHFDQARTSTITYKQYGQVRKL